MTDPIISGRLTGYDVVNPDPVHGPASLDGRLDALHYRINADDTATVYVTMPDGTEAIIADEVEWMERDGEDYGLLHFWADTDVTVKDQLIPGDGQPELVTVMWKRTVKESHVQVETFFNEGSRQFSAILDADPVLKADFTHALAKKYSYSGGTWSDAQDLNNDGLCDLAHVEVTHYGAFVLPSTDTPYGHDYRDPNRACDARVDVMFTQPHAP